MTPKNIVYFDLETRRTANDAGGWDKKRDMGMSVGVTYSTGTGEYRIFREETADELVDQLRRADLVVGFNVVNFDYEVLMGYTVLDLPSQLETLDMMVELEKVLGHRLKLESLAQATLGVGKSAEGLDAIKWVAAGQDHEHRRVLLLRREGNQAGPRIRPRRGRAFLHGPFCQQTARRDYLERMKDEG